MKPLRSGLVGGVPTKMDVDKLIEAFGVPSEGRLISYGEISREVGCDRDTTRFKTVVHAWRRRLYKVHNVVLDCEPNKGYRVADPTTRVVIAKGQHVGGLRRIRRAGAIAGTTSDDRLDPEHRRVRDHLVRVSSVLQLAAATEAKRITMPAQKSGA